MAPEVKGDPDLEWLDHVRPVALVVAPILLKELGLVLSRQTQNDTAVVAEHVGCDVASPDCLDFRSWIGGFWAPVSARHFQFPETGSIGDRDQFA
jgi:hypothetical protein